MSTTLSGLISCIGGTPSSAARLSSLLTEALHLNVLVLPLPPFLHLYDTGGDTSIVVFRVIASDGPNTNAATEALQAHLLVRGTLT